MPINSEQRSLRVALCQIDTIVGALRHNADLAIDALEVAIGSGCDVAIFPELTIPGYPPEDLLHKPKFVADNVSELERVAAATASCDTVAVVGFVQPGETRAQASSYVALYNAAAICADGGVVGIYRKHELPNYSVFDEKRYFEPGTETQLWSIAGVNVGVSICEDMWIDDGPSTVLAAAGAQLILNINASPYHQGKPDQRKSLVSRRATESGVPFAYVNLVGGQDDLVFDGGSMVMAADGNLVAQAKMFEEQVLVADFAVPRQRPPTASVCEVADANSVSMTGRPPVIEPALSPMAELWSALVLATRDYVHNNGFSDIALGLSGGIDSTLVACIASEALGASHVHAILMPSRFSSDHSIADAEKLSINLGIEHRVVPIEPGHAALLSMLDPSFIGTESDVTEENLQSRIRGVVLMALANKFGWLVLTTGNKSETAVGYSTLYGDTAGAFACIKDVWKLQVYKLCRWYNIEAGDEIIPDHVLQKAPSAELRPDQRDDQSLPPYEQLDPLLVALVEENRTAADLVAAGHDADIVHRIARLVDIAEFKRRQSPPGPRVSHRSFGRDRRMPITNLYRGIEP